MKRLLAYRGTPIYRVGTSGAYVCMPFEIGSVKLSSQHLPDIFRALDSMQGRNVQTQRTNRAMWGAVQCV